METIEILEKLVQFNTIKDLENEKMIEWIQQYLQKYGFVFNKTIDKLEIMYRYVDSEMELCSEALRTFDADNLIVSTVAIQRQVMRHTRKTLLPE